MAETATKTATRERGLSGNVITRIDAETERWLRAKKDDEGLSRSEVLRLALRASMLLDKLHDARANPAQAAKPLGGADELAWHVGAWRRELAETWERLFPAAEARFRTLFAAFVLSEAERGD